MVTYERYVLQRYALALVPYLRKNQPHPAALSWWLANTSRIGVTNRPGPLNEADYEILAADEIRPGVVQLQGLAQEALPDPSRLQRQVQWICGVFGLNKLDAEILGLLGRFRNFPVVRDLAAVISELPISFHSGGQDDELNLRTMARLLGVKADKVKARLRPSGPLLGYGLVEDRLGGDYSLSAPASRVMEMRTTAPERLQTALLGRSETSSLTWQDFDHLNHDRELALSVMRDALSKQRKGINILLYGAPGTGKTEFARRLATEAGANAHPIGEQSKDGDEPTRGDRIAALALANATVGRAGGRVLVVDEADDLFIGLDPAHSRDRRGSKVFMHRLVERAEAPVIWIVNDPDLLGPAVIRRMSLTIRFPTPPRSVRQRIVERTARRLKLRLSPDATRLVSEVDVAPAIIENALRTAKRVGGGAQTAIAVARSAQQAMGTQGTKPPIAGLRFDPALSTADVDLTSFADKVSLARSPALSFCFYGPPGTGKSAYARFLADRLGLDVIERRASDILSMFVGGSERAIAEMFNEAADTRAFLILDEADSLLRDRSAARHSWEVTQVNEMLTWMERHPHPFAVTTNAFDTLDTATMRRFLFKVRFLPMNSKQIVAAYRAAFDATPVPAVTVIEGLTPGDIAVVKRKADVLGELDHHLIAAWLAEEVAAKRPGVGTSNRMGFL